MWLAVPIEHLKHVALKSKAKQCSTCFLRIGGLDQGCLHLAIKELQEIMINQVLAKRVGRKEVSLICSGINPELERAINGRGQK